MTSVLYWENSGTATSKMAISTENDWIRFMKNSSTRVRVYLG